MTDMTKRDFDKLTRQLLEPLMLPLGFRDVDAGYYKRPRGALQDVVVLDPARPLECYYVLFGIHLPFLRSKSVFIDGIDQPVAEISHRLGTFSEPPDRNRNWACADRQQLETYLPRMVEEFEATALPWFQRYQTILDVAAEFRRREIDEPPGGWPRGVVRPPANVFAWATYGWMLEEAGQRQEAVAWLRRAYEVVAQPLFVKDGRPVPAETKGARRARHPQPEERLEELLRQSLNLPTTAP